VKRVDRDAGARGGSYLFAVGVDLADLRVVALGLLLLLDGRDDAPGRAAGANHVCPTFVTLGASRHEGLLL
jgi:hypothetical protein